MTTLDITIVVFYMVGIMAIGIYAGYRKNTSSEQFFLAGKTLRWPVIGAALLQQTSRRSTWSDWPLTGTGLDSWSVILNGWPRSR